MIIFTGRLLRKGPRYYNNILYFIICIYTCRKGQRPVVVSGACTSTFISRTSFGRKRSSPRLQHCVRLPFLDRPENSRGSSVLAAATRSKVTYRNRFIHHVPFENCARICPNRARRTSKTGRKRHRKNPEIRRNSAFERAVSSDFFLKRFNLNY